MDYIEKFSETIIKEKVFNAFEDLFKENDNDLEKNLDEDIDKFIYLSGTGNSAAINIKNILLNCRIPDDCIDKKRFPLFFARDVLRELVQSMQSTGRA